MPTKLPVIARPADLRYDHGETLPGGAQFVRLDSVDALRDHWSEIRDERPYACCGTGADSPPLFLEPTEWIFAPTIDALVSAVTRWHEFGITPRWYDALSDESEVHDEIAQKRIDRRKRRIAEGRWSGADEIAFIARSEKEPATVLKGYWRIANLPCGLTHFDWFSEHARVPTNPELAVEVVSATMRHLTYEDWKRYQAQDGVAFLHSTEIDDDIAERQRERDKGRA